MEMEGEQQMEYLHVLSEIQTKIQGEGEGEAGQGLIAAVGEAAAWATAKHRSRTERTRRKSPSDSACALHALLPRSVPFASDLLDSGLRRRPAAGAFALKSSQNYGDIFRDCI